MGFFFYLNFELYFMAIRHPFINVGPLMKFCRNPRTHCPLAMKCRLWTFNKNIGLRVFLSMHYFLARSYLLVNNREHDIFWGGGVFLPGIWGSWIEKALFQYF